MTPKTIINKNWYLIQAMNSFLLILGISGVVLWDGTDKLDAIIPLMIGIVLVAGYMLLLPNRVSYDECGITVHYMFGLKTYAGWTDLRSVCTSVHFAVFPWQECYEIGYFKSGIIFHCEACIPKNKKTTRMLDECYPRKIT